MMRTLRNILLALTAILGLGGTAVADQMASQWTGIPEAEVRLVAGHVEGQGDMLGLQFVMAPKWKVYWRSPGDAGFPPRPDWSDSTGLRDMKLEWPLPLRFTFYGLETFGYQDEVILPVRMVRDPDKAGQIKLDLFYAACAEICVPVRVDIALDLPPGDWPANRHAKAIGRALATAPLAGPGALTVLQARMTKGQLEIELETPKGLTEPDLIVEGGPDFVFGRPACFPEDRRTTCSVPLIEPKEDVALAGKRLTLTLSDSTYAAETEVTVAGQ